METYFRTDVSDTAGEVFDEELVIAHYGSGIYYSFSRSATLVWQGFRNGLSLSQVIEWLERHFTTDNTAIAESVKDFADKLLQESLVIKTEESIGQGQLPSITITAWSEPLLEKFDDLQELLLLDPVHDVSEPGWPHRPDDHS